MNIEFKKLAKQACIGFSMAALLGSLAACSGSGSPAAAPAANNNNGGTDNNNGDNGGNTGGEKPCIDTSIVKPNTLFPTYPDIKYQYFTDDVNKQETILDYKCAQTVENGATKTNLYPLDYKIAIKGEGDNKDVTFTVTELMSSTANQVVLHGYKIRDIPLSVIAPKSTRNINVDILPSNPLTLHSNLDTQGIQNEHNYGETKLQFAGLTNEDIANVIRDLVPALREAGYLADINDFQINLGLTALAALDPAGKGLLVNASGYSKLVTKTKAIVWGPNGQKSGDATEIEQVMRFEIKSSDYGLPIEFGFRIEVGTTMQLLPNVGPVLRRFVVNTTKLGSNKETAENSTEASSFGSLDVGVKLAAITEGDTDKDDIVDVLDNNIGNTESINR